MRFLRAIAAIAVGWAAALVVGAAVGLSLTSGTLGAASLSTPRCTNAALSVLPNLTASTVASVTVGTLPAACATATLQVAVDNGTTSSTGSAAVPAGGGNVTVTLAVPVALTTTFRTDLVLVGP
jgi:hypothetical protein